MATDKQWTDAVQKLFEQTNAGLLKWTVSPEIMRPDVVGHVFTTRARDRVIAIYEFEYPWYNPDTDETITDTNVAVEFIDQAGNLEYRWPKTRFHWALLEKVRFSVTAVQSFLDEFLGNP